MLEELCKTASALSETMLFRGEQVVFLKIFDEIFPYNPLKYFNHMGGEGDWPVVCRVSFIPFLIDWCNELFFICQRNSTSVE